MSEPLQVITIHVEDGVVRDVVGVPPGVQVTIRDYDFGSHPSAYVFTDEHGKKYVGTEYTYPRHDHHDIGGEG